MDLELFGYYLVFAQATVLQSQRGEMVGRGRNAWHLNSSEVLALAEADHQARKLWSRLLTPKLEPSVFPFYLRDWAGVRHDDKISAVERWRVVFGLSRNFFKGAHWSIYFFVRTMLRSNNLFNVHRCLNSILLAFCFSRASSLSNILFHV